MESPPERMNSKKAVNLRAQAARFDNGFKRKYPLLVDYVTGLRPLEDCTAAFYREKIRDHIRLMEQLRREAAALETSARD